MRLPYPRLWSTVIAFCLAIHMALAVVIAPEASAAPGIPSAPAPPTQLGASKAGTNTSPAATGGVASGNSAPFNLDLTSTKPVVTSNLSTSHPPVIINIGGNPLQVNSQTLLTPAERLAVYQVLHSGTQSILLGGNGAAIGGSMAIGANFSNYVSSLTVAPNVIVLDRITAAGSGLSLTGNLINFGSIYAYSSSLTAPSAILQAANINNNAGGTISTVIPGNISSYLGQAPTPHLNLSLIAANNVFNAGSIISAANLTITAGGTITNATPANAASTQPATMQAGQNLLLNASTVTNSGLLSALAGNIQFNSTVPSNLLINNVSGRIEALAGAIRIRDSSFTGNYGLTLIGGNLAAGSLEMYSGCGVVNVNVENLVGQLNISGGEAHVNASTPSLELGNIQLSGDPTFYNHAGSIVINSPLQFNGASLALVASEDIVTAPGATIINTGSSTGNGGDLLLVAGANFTSSGVCCVNIGQTADTTSTLTITGSSGTGGKIDLSSGTAITSMTSASTAPNGKGGNITLIAFANADPSSGSITLPAALTVHSGGSGTGANGDVLMIAGAASGSGINIGDINSNGGSAGSGHVTLTTAVPFTSGGGACAPCVTINNGTITGGSFVPGNTLSATLTAGNVISGGAPVSITSNGNIGTGNISSSPATTGNGGTVTLMAGTGLNTGTIDVSGTGNGNGGSINITAAGPLVGSLIANGAGTGNGGTVFLHVTTNNVFTIAPGTSANGVNGVISANSGTAGGAGGSISIRDVTSGGAGGIATGSGLSLSATASGGNGGSINLTPVDFTGTVYSPVSIGGGTLSVDGAGGNSNGGSIFIQGSTLTLGGSGSTSLSANGSGTGNGGSINIQLSSGTATPLSIGTGAAQLQLSATGGSAGSAAGNGGTINIRATGTLTVDPSAIKFNAIGSNGNGGSLTLTSASADTLISGSLNADGKGAGNGGLISIAAATTDTFIIDPTAVTNGIAGILSANSGPLGGSAGSISVQNSGNVTLISQSSISLTAVSGNGGSLSLAGSQLTMPGGTYSFNGTGASGNGGTFTLRANPAPGLPGWVFTGATNLNIQANGSGTGNGGSVSLTTDNQNLVFGSGAGQILVSATGGSPASTAGNGGRLFVQLSGASSSITMDPSAVTLAPLGANGNGASYDLENYIGTVSVNNTLDARGIGTGSGGSITIATTGAFTVGASTGNSVNGQLLATAGTTSGQGGSIYLRIVDGSALTITSLADLDVRPTHGAGGSLALVAGNLNIPSGTLDANAAGGNFNGGAVELALGGALSNSLVLSANASGTGNGGSVSVGGVTVGLLPNQVQVSATGGSPGSSSGNGGQFSIGDNSVVDSAAVNINPLGTNGNGGTWELFSAFSSITVNGSIVANGVGNGDGGKVFISNDSGITTVGGSSGTLNITGNIQADGGPLGGNGGTIFVWGTGFFATADVNILSPISASASKGAGGQISIFTIVNSKTTLAANIAANAGGSGNFAGGNIEVEGYNSLLLGGAAPISLSANATGSGRGGMITVGGLGATGIGTNIVLGTGPGQLSISALGSGSQIGITAAATGSSITGDISAIVATPIGSGNGPSITLQSSGILALNGSINANAAGTGNGGRVNLSWSDASPFVIGGVPASSGITGSVSANAAGGGVAGSVILSGATTYNILSSVSATGAAPAPGSSAGISFQTTGSLTVSGPGTLSGLVSASATSIFLNPQAAGEVLSIGTLNASAGNVTLTATSAGASIAIPYGSSITATGSITLTTAALNNSGNVSSTGNGTSINVTSGSALSLSGPGGFAITGGSGTISLDGASITSTGSFAFNPGPSGQVIMSATSAPGISFGSCTIQTILSGATLTITTPTLSLADNTTIEVRSNAANALTINSPAGSPLSVSVANGGTATLQVSTGGTININPDAGQPLSFNVAPAGSATLQTTGGPLVITDAGGTVTIGSGFSLVADNNVTVQLNNGTLTNNGTLSSTGGTFGGLVSLNSTGDLAIGGTSRISAGTSNITGQIAVTATGNLSIAGALSLLASEATLTGDVSVSNNAAITSSGAVTIDSNSGLSLLGIGSITVPSGNTIRVTSAVNQSSTVTGNQTFDAGPAGQIVIQAPGSTLTIGAAAIETVKSGSSLTLEGQTIAFGSNSLVTASGASAITMSAGGQAIPLNITAPALSSATVSTTGGTISVTSTAGQPLKFLPAGVGATTLNLNGGTVTTTSTGATTTVNAGFSLATDNNLTMNANNSTLNINDTGNITALRNLTLNGTNGVAVGAVGGAGSAINAGQLAAGLNALSTNMSDYDMSSVVNPGQILISSSAGSVTLGDNITMISRGAGVGITSSQNIGMGNGDSIVTQGGNIAFSGGTAVTIGGAGNFASVARLIPGAAPMITTTGYQAPAYQGGGILIYAGLPALNLNTVAQTLVSNRSPAGAGTVSPSVDTTGATISRLNGGTIEMIATGPGEVSIPGTTFVGNGGVISIDPPGFPITIGGGTFTAIAPALSPIPPPIPTLPSSTGPIGISGPVVSTPPISAPVFNTPPGVAATMTNLPLVPSIVLATIASNSGVPEQQQELSTQASIANSNQLTTLPPNTYIVGQRCNPFVIDNEDLVVAAGENGSVFSYENAFNGRTDFHSTTQLTPSRLSLQDGKITVMGGKRDVVVSTPQGDVFVAAGASAIIEHTQKGVLRATHLTGDDLEFNMRAGATHLTAGGAEELEIADSGVDEEELIPADGVGRQLIDVQIVLAGSRQKTVQKHSYNKTQMLGVVHLMLCDTDSHLHLLHKRARELDVQMGTASNDIPTQQHSPRSQKSISSLSTPYKPIAFQTRQAESARANLVAISTADAIVKHFGNASFTQREPSSYSLESGEILVSTRKPVTIRSRNCSLRLKADATALITRKNDLFSVKNLSDHGDGSIVVNIGHNFATVLGVGDEVVSGLQADGIKGYLSDGVARRNSRLQNVAPDCSVMTSELSVGMLIKSNAILNRIYYSQNEDDKAIKQKLLKMGTILSVVTANHGPFHSDH